MTSASSSEPHDAGATPPGEHRRILAHYRATQTGAGWHTAPDDGYLYANLASHLAALAPTDQDAARELKALFADHSWLHVRAAQPDSESESGAESGSGAKPRARYAGYLEDLALYWGTVQRRLLGELAAGEPCVSLVDSIWCALLTSSVTALANAGDEHGSPEDAEFDTWSALLAFGVPISLLDARRKAEVLLRIVGPEPDAPASPSIPTRRLPPEVQRLRLAKAAALTEEQGRGWALYELVAGAAYNDLGALLEATVALGDVWVLVRVTYELAKRADSLLLRRLLTAAAAITEEAARISALEVLAPRLTGDLVTAAVRMALALQEEGASAKIIYVLAPQLEGSLLELAVADIMAVADRRKRAQLFGVLAPRLPGRLLARALPIAGGLERPDPLLNFLAALVDQFDLRAVPGTFAAVQQLALAEGNGATRARLLALLALQLEGPTRRRLVAEALTVVMQLAYGPHKIEVLRGLAPLLEAEEFELAYAIAAKAATDTDCAGLLGVLAPHLPGDLLRQAAATAEQLQETGPRGAALAALAPQFAGDARRQLVFGALLVAAQTWNQETRCDILCTLAPYFDAELRPVALAHARLLPAKEARTRALLAIGRYCEAAARRQLYDEALAAALRVQEPAARCSALLLLADELEGAGREQAFGAAMAAAQEVCSLEARALLLGKLGALPAGLAPRKVMLQALVALEQVTDWRIHAAVLAALAPHLDDSLMVMALVAVRKIDENIPRLRALAVLLACPHPAARRSAWLLLADDLFYRFRTRPRAELYACLALPGLLAPPFVDGEMAAAVAAGAVRLDRDWQWPV